ncbi:protein of unknown function [Quadrisphaera granulorum]|uniref:Uncharacterized protein DUF4190 n=1 Tax=Quadrisphaera granulorum TaxID=317664 RepID=A0A316AFX2_9ACTN|nr:DUF4190 domain-containing protein [Quadrisphaera granulorum]PWJ55870.1 uncharacterized protein DUF4190 [Quadrisphaera granulorum]SZE95367.1 protein of unknown function [Quadrisphaera granulorum]
MSQPTAGYGYGGPPPPVMPPPARPTDTMAVLGLVFAFVFAPLGLVFSILGLKNTRRDGTQGRGLALAGLWVSIAVLALVILAFALWLLLVVALVATGSTAP